jgi:hypothetical protein
MMNNTKGIATVEVKTQMVLRTLPGVIRKNRYKMPLNTKGVMNAIHNPLILLG